MFSLSERQINFVARVLREDIESKRTLNEGDLRYYNELSNRALVEKFFSYNEGINLNEGIFDSIKKIVMKAFNIFTGGANEVVKEVQKVNPKAAKNLVTKQQEIKQIGKQVMNITKSTNESTKIIYEGPDFPFPPLSTVSDLADKAKESFIKGYESAKQTVKYMFAKANPEKTLRKMKEQINDLEKQLHEARKAGDYETVKELENTLKGMKQYYVEFRKQHIPNLFDKISEAFSKFNIIIENSISNILQVCGVDSITANQVAVTIAPYVTGVISLIILFMIIKLVKLIIKMIKSLVSKAKKGKEAKEEALSEAKKAASISLSMQKQIASKIDDPDEKAKAMERIKQKEQKLKAVLAKK